MVQQDAPFSRRLPAEASSVSEARRIMRELLAADDHSDLLESAELVVSELVTNALVHAGTPIEVTVHLGKSGIRVEVADGSPHFPQPRNYHETAGTGRGLRLLKQLVDRWGADPDGTGKVVWFELGLLDGSGNGNGNGTENAEDIGRVARWRSDPGTVNVRLLNVPLLLHAAWHQHCEALLREYLLTQLDHDDPATALEMHAASSEALSLLVEQVPAPDVGDQPEALMANLTEPGVSLASLLLKVPADSVENFRLLDSMLETAVQMADDGELLTPTTQPELRALRRWICREVDRQKSGDAPSPWSSIDGANAPGEGPDWDSGPITRSSLARVAVDDTDRIVAISHGAGEFLGYDDPAELVGKRLLTIIPTRYHQAHLAGFTLHLTTGRDALIGQTVTVPFVRKDGTERTADLVVTALQLPQGRRGFVGDLSPAG